MPSISDLTDVALAAGGMPRMSHTPRTPPFVRSGKRGGGSVTQTTGVGGPLDIPQSPSLTQPPGTEATAGGSDTGFGTDDPGDPGIVNATPGPPVRQDRPYARAYAQDLMNPPQPASVARRVLGDVTQVLGGLAGVPTIANLGERLGRPGLAEYPAKLERERQLAALESGAISEEDAAQNRSLTREQARTNQQNIEADRQERRKATERAATEKTTEAGQKRYDQFVKDYPEQQTDIPSSASLNIPPTTTLPPMALPQYGSAPGSTPGRPPGDLYNLPMSPTLQQPSWNTIPPSQQLEDRTLTQAQMDAGERRLPLAQTGSLRTEADPATGERETRYKPNPATAAATIARQKKEEAEAAKEPLDPKIDAWAVQNLGTTPGARYSPEKAKEIFAKATAKDTSGSQWEVREATDKNGVVHQWRVNKATGESTPPVSIGPIGKGTEAATEARQDHALKQATLKNYEPALDSAERFNVMTQNYEDAVKSNDQQAMLSLLSNHLGMTMGLQKGARLNQAIIKEAQASRPWLQGMQAKFDKDGYLTGVTLTPTQMRQMVDLGHSRFTEDLTKARNASRYLGATDDGPDRTPSKATMRFYLGMTRGDVGKAKDLATQDGWTVK